MLTFFPDGISAGATAGIQSMERFGAIDWLTD
jgi:hypothetical protein